MKKMILTSVVVLFFVAAVNAQVSSAEKEVATTTVSVDDEKVEIKFDELPQAVKTTWGTDAYKGWEVVKVWHNKTKDIYEIEAKNATETKTLKFDKEGKEIKE